MSWIGDAVEILKAIFGLVWMIVADAWIAARTNAERAKARGK